MTSLIVAKRYAKALLEIGREDGNCEQYGLELDRVSQLFSQSPELEAVLSNPAFELENRTQILTSLLAKVGVSPLALNFFRLLLDRGRIAHVAGIQKVYAKLLDQEKGITRVDISSAVALKDEEATKLAEVLKEVAGKEVEIEVKEDPSLIGGVVARIGDLVLDGSVKTQLASLKETLKRGEYS